MRDMKELALLLKEVVILYVEDDRNTREEVYQVLSLLSNKVITASNGEEGYKMFATFNPKIIITDIEMPISSGISFVKKVRRENLEIPIIVLTAYTTQDYLLRLSNLNIQAYLVKPLSFNNLKDVLHNISKLLRLGLEMTYSITEDFIYDKTNGVFINTKDKATIRLHTKEKKLMDLFIDNGNRLISYEEIECYVWSGFDEIMTSMALRTVVKSLRQKIPYDFIQNISGQGYRMNLPI